MRRGIGQHLVARPRSAAFVCTQYVTKRQDRRRRRDLVRIQFVEPGRIVDISVDMVAPTSPGTYTSFWRLQRPNGELFGDQAYVRIIVP